jgi:integrase
MHCNQSATSPTTNGGAGRRIVRWPHVKRYTDRWGTERIYFRPDGRKLPGPIGSPEFCLAYGLAMSGIATAPVKIIDDDRGRAKPRTWAAALGGFQTTPEWTGVRENTRKSIRYQLQWIGENFGDALVADMTHKELNALIVAKGQRKPGMARMLLRAFRGALKFAREQEWITGDPSIGIKKPKLKNADGHRMWNDDEVAAYRARHALGTVARLAFEILLNTGLRRDDAIHVGPRHRDAEGFVTIEPAKTRGKRPGRPIVAVFTIEPELAEALAVTTTGIDTWLIAPTTRRPYSNDQFGRAFRQWCDEAGLDSELTAHGLRKACFTMLAQRHGYTAKEIMAWSGHTELKMVERYTEQVEQKALTKAAIGRRRTAG